MQKTTYNQNDGKKGVVYILGNKTVPRYLKIGQTTNLKKRLAQLNKDCKITGNPIAGYFVIYTRSSANCWRAEQQVHRELRQYRVNHKEFFDVDIEVAKAAVMDACDQCDDQEYVKDLRRSNEESRRDAEIRARVAEQMAYEKALAKPREFSHPLSDSEKTIKLADDLLGAARKWSNYKANLASTEAVNKHSQTDENRLVITPSPLDAGIDYTSPEPKIDPGGKPGAAYQPNDDINAPWFVAKTIFWLFVFLTVLGVLGAQASS